MAGGYVSRRDLTLRGGWRHWFGRIPPPDAEVVQDPPARGFQSDPIPAARSIAAATVLLLTFVVPPPQGPAARGVQSRPIQALAPAQVFAFGVPPPAEAAAETLPAGSVAIGRFQPSPLGAPVAYETLGRIPPPDELMPAGVQLAARPIAAGRILETAFGPIPPPDAPPADALPSGVQMGAQPPPASRAAPILLGRIPPPNELMPAGTRLGAQPTPPPYGPRVEVQRTLPPQAASTEPLPPGSRQVGKLLPTPPRAAPAAFQVFGRVPIPPKAPVGRGIQSRPLFGPHRAAPAAYVTVGRIPPENIATPSIASIGDQELARTYAVRRASGAAYQNVGRIPPPDIAIVTGTYSATRALLPKRSRAPDFTFGRVPPVHLELLGKGVVVIARPFVPRYPTPTLSILGQVPPPPQAPTSSRPFIAAPQFAAARAAASAFVIAIPPAEVVEALPAGARAIGIPGLPAGRAASAAFVVSPRDPTDPAPLPAGAPLVARPLRAPAQGAAVAYAASYTSRVPADALPQGTLTIGRAQLGRRASVEAYATGGRIPPPEIEELPNGVHAIGRFQPARRGTPVAYATTRGQVPPYEITPIPEGTVLIGRYQPGLRAELTAYDSRGRIPPPEIELLPAGAVLLRNGERLPPRAAPAAYWYENRFIATSDVPFVILLRHLRGHVSILDEAAGGAAHLQKLTGDTAGLEDLEGHP